MGNYRETRNIEASIIQYLEDELSSAWSNVQVEKTFKRIYSLDLPAVCIRVGDTDHDRAEIGDNATIRTSQLLIDIFALNDGQRLDIKDFLISVLRSGLIYYEYEITNGTISNKTPNGRIRVMNISDTPVDFDVEKSKLETHDRYRHLLTIEVSLGRIEG